VVKNANNERLRNIAIIAHVDHGKTTLVDQLFRQSGIIRDSAEKQERVMDSMDLERERGITIAAKNCAIEWKGVNINILDTPGHADFGGEVERALMMVDGALLLVDAAEGPLPQTRFVLSKALDRRLPIVVVVNKIDRKDARPQDVLNEIYDLFIDVGADEAQIEFPVVYAIGREGIAKRALEDEASDLSILLDTIIECVPPPTYNQDAPFQMLVLDLGYSDYLGRLATGRVFHGSARKNESLVCIGADGKHRPLRVSHLQGYKGAQLEALDEAQPGQIVVLAGADAVEIGDTIASAASPVALPRVCVDRPVIAMRFSVNSSPFSGREGKHVQLPRIEERLHRETLYNVSIQVDRTPEGEAFLVKGRGELQMSILIETMRREGFELSVGRPEVITEIRDGVVYEPIEHLVVDCDEAFVGVVTEKLARRKGRMVNMNVRSGRARIEFSIPSRGLIGYRSEFLTDTRGTGLLNGYLEGYEPFRGEIPSRMNGSLVADREGETVPYALFHLEPRGNLFVTPGEKIYEGMVIGEHNREGDLNVNPAKTKKLTNVRASGKDENVVLTPVPPLTLESAIQFIADDEIVEITPLSIRVRKKVLNPSHRK
jgi:GTP-binding protein